MYRNVKAHVNSRKGTMKQGKPQYNRDTNVRYSVESRLEIEKTKLDKLNQYKKQPAANPVVTKQSVHHRIVLTDVIFKS